MRTIAQCDISATPASTGRETVGPRRWETELANLPVRQRVRSRSKQLTDAQFDERALLQLKDDGCPLG